MKRGFFNTARYKKAIEEAYTPGVPPGQEPASQEKPSLPPGGCTADGEENASGAQDATVVDTPADEDRCRWCRCVNTRATASATQVAKGESKMASEPHDEKNETETLGESPTVAKDAKGKGKEKEIGGDMHLLLCNDAPAHTPFYLVPSSSPNGCCKLGCIPPRPLPRRPGWGRGPKEHFFHTMPASLGDPRKKRGVFRIWPRDPKGKPLGPNKKQRGTVSPDGYPWGETLYDMFSVRRLPDIHNFVSFANGSILCEVMKEIGELDAATSEIEWAMSEGKPRIEGAADTGELIRCSDMMLHLAGLAKLDARDTREGQKGDQDAKQDEKGITDPASEGGSGGRQHAGADTVPNSSSPLPTTSPFHPSHYPEPWPFTPFRNPHPILLQERIPLYLLPRTLHVHDPFGLLPVRHKVFLNTSWTCRPDIIRTYNLQLSESARLQVEEAKRKAQELEELKACTLIILRYERTKEQVKNNEPVIEVPLPPYSRRPTMVEEAHLYLSPVAKVGEGHHSVVYKGEWELPRDIFVKKRICQQCFEESTREEIQRLKDTGRYQRMLDAISSGSNGYTGHGPKRAELGEVDDPPNHGLGGETIEREVTCTVPQGIAPLCVVEKLEENGAWDMLMKQRKVCFEFTESGEKDGEKGLHVPIIRINPPFASQKPCTHQSHGPVPRTATFTVIAKLSIENDEHLEKEASNYQMFPDHFFDHYNGYIIVAQLHTTVPIHAIIPQFYGYYVPKKKGGEPSYLSPILLLEHCGQPIYPEELSDEDQEECASMLLRFQNAGWVHGSVAPRNLLVQYGKPTEFPSVRAINPEPSYRLIDFGRSTEYETLTEKRDEEMEVLRMFKRLAKNMKMRVTLDS